MPQLSGAAYSHYVSASPMLQVVSPEAAVTASQLSVVPTASYGAPATKLQRSDRIEVSDHFPCLHSLACTTLGFCSCFCYTSPFLLADENRD